MTDARLPVIGLCVFIAATAVTAGPLVPGVALAEPDEPTIEQPSFDRGTAGLGADRLLSAGPHSTTTTVSGRTATVSVSFFVETGDAPATVTARLAERTATNETVTVPAGEGQTVTLSPTVALGGTPETRLVVTATVDGDRLVLVSERVAVDE
jgi:hypothetical protein